MSRTIPFSETNFGSLANTISNTDIANSVFNPVERTSKVSVYAVQNLANDIRLTFRIGGETHVDDAPVPFDTGLALSTRDHLMGTGIAYARQKFNVGYRETGSVATTDLQGYVILEPLA